MSQRLSRSPRQPLPQALSQRLLQTLPGILRKLLLAGLFAGLFVAITPGTLFAAELNESELKPLVEKAMAKFVLNRIDDGYKVFQPYWPMPEHELTSLIDHTDRQWNSVALRYGESIGFEHISTQRAGKSLLQYTYIQKLRNHALRWEFRFYKAKDKWQVNAVAFDDRIDALFRKEEKAGQ